MTQVKPSNQRPQHIARYKGPGLLTRMRWFVGLIVGAHTLFGMVLIVSTRPALLHTTWLWAGLTIGAASLAAMFAYTRKLLSPLGDIRQTAARVACGRFDQPAEIHAEDETGRLAELINDIAANQQEILLHLWNQAGNCIQAIDRLQAEFARRFPNDGLGQIKEDLASVRNNMESLRALADGVELYQVQLHNGRASAAASQPGQERRQVHSAQSGRPVLAGPRFTPLRTRD